MSKTCSLRRARKTKIIATLGPASSDPASIRALFEAGADVFRLNFSHGSHADHAQRYNDIPALEREPDRPIAVLADLQGPKLRLGVFAEGGVQMATGDCIRLDLDSTPGAAAIMVARGDLGVELPPETVPGLQKRIVRACRPAGKPVVVATQIKNEPAAPRPQPRVNAGAARGGAQITD